MTRREGGRYEGRAESAWAGLERAARHIRTVLCGCSGMAHESGQDASTLGGVGHGHPRMWLRGFEPGGGQNASGRPEGAGVGPPGDPRWPVCCGAHGWGVGVRRFVMSRHPWGKWAVWSWGKWSWLSAMRHVTIVTPM